MNIKEKFVLTALAAIFIISFGLIVWHFASQAFMLYRSEQARQVAREVLPRYIYEFAMYETHEQQISFMDFDALRAAFGNDDIIAHLHVYGTAINYLVVQTANNTFYQNHDIWRNRSAAGWVFLDYEVDLQAQDHNIVIYAHNMRREHKFHSLRHFNSYNFFRLHPYIYLTTPYGEYRWHIFSFYSTFIDFSYNIINFPNEAARSEMIRIFEANSMHNAGVSVSPDDRILTLSTCTNRNRDERYVLHARLISFHQAK